MLQIVPQMRILLCVEPVDFRRGVDALTSLCRRDLCTDPFSGALFVFRNRGATSIRLLVYDETGFWLCTKRLSRGRFSWWPKTAGSPLEPIAARHLQVLLASGNPLAACFAPEWRKLA